MTMKLDFGVQGPASLSLSTTMSSEPISGRTGTAATSSGRCMAVWRSQRTSLSALCGTRERLPAYQRPRATATLRTPQLLCTARRSFSLSQACPQKISHLHGVHRLPSALLKDPDWALGLANPMRGIQAHAVSFANVTDCIVSFEQHPKLRYAAGNQHFRVWRALLQPDSRHSEQNSSKELTGSVRALRERPGHWAVILSRGGHFAATLFNVHVKPGKGQGKHETSPFEVLTHKTFHKYVVR